MAAVAVTPVSVRFPPTLLRQLRQHLFPGDGDEHGAVLAASVLRSSRGTRLLVHRLFLARDGIDYLPGTHGYRMLTAHFVLDCVLECADLQMAYLAVHCHGGTDRVGFSATDMESHERGYQALLDIVDGPPVGALVFAADAVAGDIWFADGTRADLQVLVEPNQPIREMRSSPPAPPPHVSDRFDRQSRLFGDRGQARLSGLKVGVIGAGGAGSLIVEQLSRLGVGQVVVIDPESIEPTNLPRVVGSRRRDVHPVLSAFMFVGDWLPRLRTSKVRIAARHANETGGRGQVVPIRADVVDPGVASSLCDCDYLFLAADSMQSRLVFNALVHQYLIPGVQMGVKVQIERDSGDILDVFTVTRPVLPGQGCLWCNGLILADQLQEEATDPNQVRRQRYVDDADVPAPSVITLNAIAASLATDGFLMDMTGLREPGELTWIRHNPRTNEFIREVPSSSPACTECTTEGRLGRGSARRLPVKLESSK